MPSTKSPIRRINPLRQHQWLTQHLPLRQTILTNDTSTMKNHNTRIKIGSTNSRPKRVAWLAGGGVIGLKTTPTASRKFRKRGNKSSIRAMTKKSNKSRFFVQGVSDTPDPNPIIDGGAPASTDGTIQASSLCNLLGIPLKVTKPEKQYLHGWGIHCADTIPI